jgi:hypothetical protein
MSGRKICICLAVTSAALALGGCGSSQQAEKARHRGQATLSPANVCRRASRQAVASFFSLPAAGVVVAGSTGNDLMPQCTFTVDVAGKPVRLIADISNAPSPYFVLERTAVEASQIFTPTALIKPPQNVTGLGLDADWFFEEQHLMTTDGRRLVTVTVTWPRAPTPRKIAIADAVARTYLGPNDEAAAKLYP